METLMPPIHLSTPLGLGQDWGKSDKTVLLWFLRRQEEQGYRLEDS